MDLTNLRILMDRDGVTQKDLAVLIDRDKAVITNLFNEQRQVTTDEAQIWARRFGVTVSELINEVPIGYLAQAVDYNIMRECWVVLEAITKNRSNKDSPEGRANAAVELYKHLFNLKLRTVRWPSFKETCNLAQSIINSGKKGVDILSNYD